MDDEAHASKRQLFDVHASAGDAAHAAAMQQQQQQQWQLWAALKAADEAATAAASTATGTTHPVAAADLQEDTSLEEEEAMEALLGFAAHTQTSGSHGINEINEGQNVTSEMQEEVGNTSPQ